MDGQGLCQLLLLLCAPQGSWNVELHLAAAALARTTQQQRWHDHLVQAQKMIGEKHLSKQVRDIAAHIREIKPP